MAQLPWFLQAPAVQDIYPLILTGKLLQHLVS